jgi:hypothetical protein
MLLPVSKLALHAPALAFGAALLVTLLPPTDAHAEWVARPLIDGLVVIDDKAVAGGALGGAVFGYNAELEPILVVPEVAAGFGGFGGEVDGWLARALAGVRAGITASVEPSVFVHLGYGYGSVTRVGVRHGEHGFALRTGLALDYRIKRWLTLGGELVYDVMLFDEAGVKALHAAGGGVNVAFWF